MSEAGIRGRCISLSLSDEEFLGGQVGFEVGVF